jgi:hypothetical protein
MPATDAPVAFNTGEVPSTATSGPISRVAAAGRPDERLIR